MRVGTWSPSSAGSGVTGSGMSSDSLWPSSASDAPCALAECTVAFAFGDGDGDGDGDGALLPASRSLLCALLPALLLASFPRLTAYSGTCRSASASPW